jgi:hypothetical protein
MSDSVVEGKRKKKKSWTRKVLTRRHVLPKQPQQAKEEIVVHGRSLVDA